jgi:phasin
MTETYSVQAAADQARQTYQKATRDFERTAVAAAREFDALRLDTTVPESVRALAEKTVNQTREAYERGKEALEETVDALERSFDAAGQGAAAFNRKLIDIAQRNLNSGFDLAKSLAGAKNLGEIVELQSAFLRSQFDAFANQAGEIRALSSKIAADTAEPIKAQVSRSFEAVRRV